MFNAATIWVLIPLVAIIGSFITKWVRINAEADRRTSDKGFDELVDIVRRLEPIAAAKHCTLAQLALAWVLSRGTAIVPIFGAKHVHYVEENVGALDVRLTAEDLARLDGAAPKGATAGLRYPASAIGNVNR